MDIKRVDIDYEKQTFEDFDVNLYEIVIAVSKMAREINDKAQKYLGPETEIKPINMALKKLESGGVDFVYKSKGKNTSSEDSSTNKQ